MLTVGSCFSGIGGLELGLEWTGGFKTKWQIEIDPYASSVLAKHWPDVKRYSDIRDVVRPPAVDVICGGFPCQDVSLAGKRLGLEGKRTTLWTELFRLVRETRPKWFLGENVPGLLSANDGRFFGNILRDLASIGFDAEWGVLSAAGVGAHHLRRRVFVLAHPVRGSGSPEPGQQQSERAEITDSSGTGDVAHPGREHGETRPEIKRVLRGIEAVGETCNLLERSGQMVDSTSDRLEGGERSSQQGGSNRPTISSWWETEPGVGRVAHGVPSRMDRLKCLGNAVVPQVAQKVGEMILDYERNSFPAQS